MEADSPEEEPNRSNCPSMVSFEVRERLSRSTGTICRMARRLQPMLSKAPARIRFSSVRRFISEEYIREQKSSKEENRPFVFRSETSELITFRPIPLIATSPKRMFSPETVKSGPDSLTSGGRRAIPIALHSAIYSAIFTLLSSTLVRRAAMYSRG